MKLLKYIKIGFTVFLLFFVSNSFVNAQTSTYINNYYNPQNLSGTSDLVQKLESEVQKVISNGHLAPFRTLYGETDIHFYWYRRLDTVYTLSLAYPYVNSSLQNQIKSYLQTHMQNYPLWNSTLLPVSTGTRREPDILDANQIGVYYQDYNNRPKLFAMYALWLYANNTGDWNYIQNNWSNITSFYNSNSSEVTSLYSGLSGGIGVVRMAQQKPVKDQTIVNAVTSNLNTGFNNSTNFNTFALNAENRYKTGSGDWTNWTRKETYLGFHFLDMSPEVGRYIYNTPTLKNGVVGTKENVYTLAYGEWMYPLWYLAQSPSFTRYYGEGSAIPVDVKSMLFPLKAWVQKEPASKLRTYLDVPDALIGDYYYMQNLVYTIQAHGTECWEDITTTTQECSSTVTPTPTPTATPTITPTPVPTPQYNYDVNGDTQINLDDVMVVISGIFGTSIQGDVNNDGKVDLTDLIILVPAVFPN